MHRIDGPGATVDNRFTGGDPQTATPATVVTAAWLNDLQENLLAVLAEGGIEPTKGRAADLVDALTAMIAELAPVPESTAARTHPSTTVLLQSKAMADHISFGLADHGLGNMGQRNLTISNALPSGGVDGDVWFRWY